MKKILSITLIFFVTFAFAENTDEINMIKSLTDYYFKNIIKENQSFFGETGEFYIDGETYITPSNPDYENLEQYYSQVLAKSLGRYYHRISAEYPISEEFISSVMGVNMDKKKELETYKEMINIYKTKGFNTLANKINNGKKQLEQLKQFKDLPDAKMIKENPILDLLNKKYKKEYGDKKVKTDNIRYYYIYAYLLPLKDYDSYFKRDENTNDIHSSDTYIDLSPIKKEDIDYSHIIKYKNDIIKQREKEYQEKNKSII